MWKTLHLSGGDLVIATKAWSDFSANIPVIRSFSFGSNFPPQYPLFAGPPIRYHFVFYALVGILEKSGIPLDYALNGLSVIGFFGLLLLIYYFAFKILKKRAAATLSVIFFLFNGSLGFLEFFSKNPLGTLTIVKILNNQEFSSFGPFDGKIVSAFWNLNIYTNQRHLALGYLFLFLILLFIYIFQNKPAIFSDKRAVFLGVLIGIFPFVHLSTFVMTVISLLIFFIFFKELRRGLLITLIVTGILALPQFLYMGLPQNKVALINPGYLIDQLSVGSFVSYWFYNLGFTILTAPLGFILISRKYKIFFMPFIVFFIIGNLFQFTPSIIDNHKFFNAFIIAANMLSAYLLVFLWHKYNWTKILAVTLFIMLTFSGLIDLFPILNDRNLVLNDLPKNKTAEFISKNTPPYSVFLNSSYIFDAASIAGRKIYLGWPYFPWSLGYDVDSRRENLISILNSSDKNFVCNFLHNEGVDYMEIHNPAVIERTNIDYQFFENNFVEIYRKDNQLMIYDLSKSCNYSNSAQQLR